MSNYLQPDGSVGYLNIAIALPYGMKMSDDFIKELKRRVNQARLDLENEMLTGRWPEKDAKWASGAPYGAYPVTSSDRRFIPVGYGPTGNTASSYGGATPTSRSTSSQEHGGKQVSNLDKVIHDLGTKWNWRVRRAFLDDGAERYSVEQGGTGVVLDRPWNEAYKRLNDFIKDAESAREALVDLATYNQPFEPEKPSESLRKGKK